MLSSLSLLLFSINFIISTTPSPVHCPEDYTVLNQKTCVKLVESPSLINDAKESCRNLTFGTLVTIDNAIENRVLINLAIAQNTTRPIWIGLGCFGSSCYWSDQGGTNYTNFASGNPQPDVGVDVYMLASGNSAGKWVSADGTLVALNYFCQVPAYNSPDFCSNPFGDYCYELNDISFYNESGARSSCQISCGNLVSIHSEEENLHVLSLSNSSSSPQVRIGARTDGTVKYWVDETAFDYSNFGYFNADIGKCSTMQISAGSIQSGQWSSNNCEDTLPFICKRKQGVYSCPPSLTRT